MNKDEVMAAYKAADQYEKTKLTEMARRFLLEKTGKDVRRSTLNYYRKNGVGSKSKQHQLFTAAYAAAIQKQRHGTAKNN